MVVEQFYIEYPCKTSKRMRKFISCLPSNKDFVCTCCWYKISIEQYEKWLVIKKKLELKGIRIDMGMKLIYPFKNKEGI